MTINVNIKELWGNVCAAVEVINTKEIIIQKEWYYKECENNIRLKNQMWNK